MNLTSVQEKLKESNQKEIELDQKVKNLNIY